MPASQSTEIDLQSLFGEVARVLKENQASLNEADAYNHDHGDNMARNFKVITQALKEKKGAVPSEQLAYASQVLSQKSKTGSAQLYSEGLLQAASQFKGQQAVTATNAMSLVQALLGGGQASPQPTPQAPPDAMGQLLGSLLGGSAPVNQSPQTEGPQTPDMLGGLMGALLGGSAPEAQTQPSAQTQLPDMLGSLMGALLGGATSPQTPQPEQSQTPDMLGGLMGAFLGGTGAQTSAQAASTGQAPDGFDLNTLLTAGMAYMQASQQGAAPLEALVQAVMAGSQMNTSPHHSQSGQLVASTLIGALGKLMGGKKR